MPRRILEGNVVGDKADKTITVEVERRYMHPMYKKYIRRNDKFAAHDPANAHKIGDRVRIIETRPISKTKTWIVMDGDAPAQDAPKKDVNPATAKKAAAPKKEDAKKAAAKKDDKPKAEKKAPAKKKPAAAKKKPAAKKDEKKDK